MPAGQPPKYNSPDELEKAIEDYFNPASVITETTKIGEIKREGPRTPREKLTITGLALHLGFESRQSLYDYEQREEFSYIIKKARLRVENGYEERLSEQACTGAIFALKNMGWKDKSEIDHRTPDGIIINYNKQEGNDPLPDAG